MSANKQKKSYALEVSLIIVAVIAAFFVQDVIKSTNPPGVPDLDGEKRAALNDEKESALDVAVKEEQQEKVPEKYNPHLSDLGLSPDWSRLDDYQFTVDKADFVRLLESVYTLRGSWKRWIEVREDHAVIRTHGANPLLTYQLYFATSERKELVKKYWRGKSAIKHTDVELPLEGVRIVLDPGHIGGNYARLEERKFKFGETAPVQEGNINLIVAQMLEQQLEVLGAEVNLTRVSNFPVNTKRVEDYTQYVKSRMEANGELISEGSVTRESEFLFYRPGEIRQRAELVNHHYRPDLVVCIHFNAGRKIEGRLHEREHAHMILNGAYMDGEIAKDDIRFQMMLKILQRNHHEEKAVSASVGRSMSMHTGLPPYRYALGSNRAINVDGDSYLWARNLAANRSYECPVIYCEPYLMNATDSHARIQVGDYEGMRYVNGMLRPSIFREYVNFVAEGLVNYYQDRELSE